MGTRRDTVPSGDGFRDGRKRWQYEPRLSSEGRREMVEQLRKSLNVVFRL